MLILMPWPLAAPCNTVGCFEPIAWKLVPEGVTDDHEAVMAGICDSCRTSLFLSIAGPVHQPAPPVETASAPEPKGTRGGRRRTAGLARKGTG